MTEARERILARVREAGAGALRTPPTADDAPEPAGGPIDPEEWPAEFAARWEAAGGEFYRAGSADELNGIIKNILADLPPGPVAVTDSATELPIGLEDVLRELDRPVCAPSPDEAKDTSAGLTSVRRAVAYSGSLLIDSRRPGQLAASLLPPTHIALVPRSRLVSDIRSVFELFREDGFPRGAVFITGASKTADIELTLVKGVHGPGRAVTVLLDFT